MTNATSGQPNSEDRPNRIPWPPLLDAMALGAAIGFQRLWPLPAFIPAPWSIWGGGLLMSGGLLVGLAGILQFRRQGTPVDPTAQATSLAANGIFAVTRNPMYVGTLLALVGLGILWPLPWLVVFVPPLACGLYLLAIRREEAYLERRFGDDYRAYKSRVRRWF